MKCACEYECGFLNKEALEHARYLFRANIVWRRRPDKFLADTRRIVTIR